jgi:ribosome-associated protein
VITSTLRGKEGTQHLSPDMKREPAASPAVKTERDPNRPAPGIDVEAATQVVLTSLEDDKAEEIVSIDIRGRSSFADMLVVASGRSARHVGALAEHVMSKLKDAGVKDVRVEGLPQADWVLVDAGDVVVHLFRPEVRAFYNIEKIWSGNHATQLPS